MAQDRMRPDYVEVTRYVREISSEVHAPLVRRMIRRATPGRDMKFEDLVSATPGTPIVLMAPSLTGKSTEMKQAARRLRRAGRHAVFAESRAVASDGLDFAVDDSDEERDAYNAWKQSSEPCVLFLDAIDEIYLANRTVRDLVRQLRRSITLGARHIQLVVSARSGSWADDYGRLFAPLAPPPEESSENGKDKPAVRLFTFLPVDDPETLGKLATARKVTGVDEFLRAVSDEEIPFDLRPCDVDWLARYWNLHKRLGTWSAMLSEVVATSFEQADEPHTRDQFLSAGEGRRALNRLGAATLLSKRPHVAAPAASTPESAISARRLFDDWPLPRLQELFENHLFWLKGATAFQLPQGGISEFLAASWFVERAHRGWSDRKLYEALLVQVFDEVRYRIPESRRAVVGWIASEAPQFRARLLRDYPEVVLFEGDPDRLSDKEIAEALTHFIEKVKLGEVDSSPTRGTVRKLARPQLQHHVRELLAASRGAHRAQQHLLRLAREGAFAACVPEALYLARATSEDPGVREGAIEVIGKAGTPNEVRKLLEVIDDDSLEVRAALLGALVPNHLSGSQLFEFLSRGGDAAFQYALVGVADKLATPDIESTVGLLLQRLSDSTAAPEEIHGPFHAAIPIAIVAAKRLSTTLGATNQLVALLLRIDEINSDAMVRLDMSAHVVSSDAQELTTAVNKNPGLRRALWAERLRLSGTDPASHYRFISRPLFADLLPEDVYWAFELLTGTITANRFHVDHLIQRVFTASDEATQAMLIDSAPSTLREELETVRAVNDEQRRRQRADEDAKRAKQEYERARSIDALKDRREAIRVGDDMNALCKAWEISWHSAGVNDRLDTSRLAAVVSSEILDDLTSGFKACWRKLNVAFPTLGDNTLHIEYLVGVMGLTLESGEGLDFATLSTPEADTASRLALHALDGLPAWLDDLLAAHPATVERVFEHQLSAEWRSTAEHGGVLSFGRLESGRVGTLVRKIVLSLLQKTSPASTRSAMSAAHVLIDSQGPVATIDPLIEREVATCRLEGDPRLIQWLRTWAHVSPTTAADWLEELRSSHPVQFLPTMLKLAAELGEDIGDGRRGNRMSALSSPSGLSTWARLMSIALPLESDEPTPLGRPYSPSERQQAQRFRNACLGRLSREPSREANLALRALLNDPATDSHKPDFKRWLLEGQLAAAAEAAAAPWTEEDVLRVERGDEASPRNLEQLCALVRTHIRRLAEQIENSDFSYRGLFSAKSKEREIQLWVAAGLQQLSRGLYSIARENAVDDDKEVDISAFAPGIGHIPIEIKPLGPYSFNALVKVVERQLLGQYMQPVDRRYGVLLLVRREKKSWKIAGKRAFFAELKEGVQQRANALAGARAKVVRIETIDLLSLPADRAKEHTSRSGRSADRTRRRTLSRKGRRGPVDTGRKRKGRGQR